MNMQAPDFNHTALAASPCLVLAGCSSSDSPSTTTQDDPTLGADDPTTPSTGNPYSPLVPGTTSRLEGQDEDGGVETVVTIVSHETHIVNGVVRSIVVDHEYKNSELVEEAFDFLHRMTMAMSGIWARQWTTTSLTTIANLSRSTMMGPGKVV